ncbi:MAG: ABC transporter substrate-binding protein [Planctomycetes bacterium]|nr:ABC transporter substrate-binding protein [Planctomycetota bacterium]
MAALALVSAGACAPKDDAAPGAPATAAAPVVIRFGHFPNVTHAHGLVAHSLTREGRGWFEERLGPGVKVEWFIYNAGPSAMEALLSGSLDVTYVGPNPALNAHLKSKGEDVRVLAGATLGGAGLVVQGDGRIKEPRDFRGKKVATPQLGNTQDVACRAWLKDAGFEITQTGGDVSVLATQNPDQLALFQKGDLDAVWTVEPWVSRLEREANGKLLVPEPDAMTTILVASAKFTKERPELARKLTDAHRALTEWIVATPADAKRLVRAELLAETRQEMSADLLDHCWPRMTFTSAIRLEDFTAFVKKAQSVGYLRDAGELSRLVAPGKDVAR